MLRGTKPKPTVVKLITGNTGKRPLNVNDPLPTGRPLPPIKMTGRPAALWRMYIARAAWLAEPDGAKAWLWCEMQAECEADVSKMTAARIGQLRALGSELGLDPSSRARLGPSTAEPDELDQYFN